MKLSLRTILGALVLLMISTFVNAQDLYPVDSGKEIQIDTAVLNPKPCVVDYTSFSDFQTVRYLQPSVALVVVDGKFLNRDLIGTGFDVPTGFIGNTLTMKATNGCKVTLWANYIGGGTRVEVNDALRLVSMLDTGLPIRVLYDPNTGLVSSIQLLI